MKPIKVNIGIMSEKQADYYESIGMENVLTTGQMLGSALTQVVDAFYKLNEGQLFSGDSVEMTVTLKYIPEDK